MSHKRGEILGAMQMSNTQTKCMVEKSSVLQGVAMAVEEGDKTQSRLSCKVKSVPMKLQEPSEQN